MGDMECGWVVGKEMRWVDMKKKKYEWKKRPWTQLGFYYEYLFELFYSTVAGRRLTPSTIGTTVVGIGVKCCMNSSFVSSLW